MPEVLMPRLSDTMAEGILSQWVKHEGDQVRKGDVLAVIETDKAAMDMEAYDEGVLTSILVEEGESVPIGTPIAVIGAERLPPRHGHQHRHRLRRRQHRSWRQRRPRRQRRCRPRRHISRRSRCGRPRSPVSSPVSTAST